MSKGKPYVDIRGYHEGVTGSTIRNTVHFSDGTVFRFLVDYGVYQGEGHKGIEYNGSVNPKKIDAVLLTHTHLDHDGALPILVKKGYNKSIYMSEASNCVLDIGLDDSYQIMVRDAKLKNRRILYSSSNIDMVMKQSVAVKYQEPIKIHPSITVTFFNNGHLIGASLILVQIEDYNSGNINLLYTGDYKPTSTFQDLQPLPSWVYLLENLTIVTESTYGTTHSSSKEEHWDEDMIKACAENKKVIISAFGQERAPLMLYRIKKLQDEGKISKKYPVFLDGTTANRYTFRYVTFASKLCIKEELQSFFPYNLQFIHNKTRQSVLNHKGGMIVISTSGMASHGPSATYVPHFLSNDNALIYVTGYAAEGTLSRRIIETPYGECVYFKGKEVVKKAKVLNTSEFSSHATYDELIELFNKFSPRSILITHGAPEVREAFKETVKEETGVKRVHTLNPEMVYRVTQYGVEKEVRK